ncbi:MAG: hypothetical protein COA82_04090 [Alkaliphilus sp.]|jgi:hypothetical protein|nr:MAG: hypothetical protein COA82_04090 [Alkaliphilus sp.]
MESKTVGLTEEIRRHIIAKLNNAEEHGNKHFSIRSGTIHKERKLQNRMPAVCSAMRSLDGFGDYEIISETESGNSSTIIYRYKL